VGVPKDAPVGVVVALRDQSVPKKKLFFSWTISSLLIKIETAHSPQKKYKLCRHERSNTHLVPIGAYRSPVGANKLTGLMGISDCRGVGEGLSR